MGTSHLIAAVIIGVGATLLMDAWNAFLKRAFRVPSLNFCSLGRLLKVPGKMECTAGWVAHYSIGISLAVVFVFLAGTAWLEQPTIIAPLVYGIVTVVFPFFLLQPALGLGFASAKSPKPTQARLKSLATHTVYGFGLYLFAQLLLHA